MRWCLRALQIAVGVASIAASSYSLGCHGAVQFVAFLSALVLLAVAIAIGLWLDARDELQ